MALIELSRVDFVPPGVFPPGKHQSRATLLTPIEGNRLVGKTPAMQLWLDMGARVIYIVNPTEKSVFGVPLEQVLQWEEKGLDADKLMKRHAK